MSSKARQRVARLLHRVAYKLSPRRPGRFIKVDLTDALRAERDSLVRQVERAAKTRR